MKNMPRVRAGVWRGAATCPKINYAWCKAESARVGRGMSVDLAALLYLNPDLVADGGLTSLKAAGAALPLDDQATRATVLPDVPAGFDARVFVAAQPDVSLMNATIRRAMLAMGISQAGVELRGTFVATIMEDVAASQGPDGALTLALSPDSPYRFTPGTLNPGDSVRMQLMALGEQLTGVVTSVPDPRTCVVDAGRRVLQSGLPMTLVGIKLFDYERQAAASYARLLLHEQLNLVGAPDPDDLGPRPDFSLGTYHAVYPDTRGLGYQDAYLDYRARWKRDNEYRIIRGRDIFNLAAPYTSNLLPASTGQASKDLTVIGTVNANTGLNVAGRFLAVSASNLFVGSSYAPVPLLGVTPDGVTAMGSNLVVGPWALSAFGGALVVAADGSLVAGGASSNIAVASAPDWAGVTRTALGAGALVVESAAGGAVSTLTVGAGALVVGASASSNVTSVGSGALVVAAGAGGSSATSVGVDALVVASTGIPSVSTTSVGAGALVVSSSAPGVSVTSVGGGAMVVSSSNATTLAGALAAGGPAASGGFLRVDGSTLAVDAGGYLLSAAAAGPGVAASVALLGDGLVVLADSVSACAGALAATRLGDVVLGGDASNVSATSSRLLGTTRTALGAGALTVDTGAAGESTTTVGSGALVVSGPGAQAVPGSGTVALGGGFVTVGPSSVAVDAAGYVLSAQSAGAASAGAPARLSALGTSLVVLPHSVSLCGGRIVVDDSGDIVAGGAASNVSMSSDALAGSTTTSIGAGACVVSTSSAAPVSATLSACSGALVAASGAGQLQASLCGGALVVTSSSGGGGTSATTSVGGGAIVVSSSNAEPASTVVTGPLLAADRVGIGMACWGTESGACDGTGTAVSTRLAVDGDVYVTGTVVSLSDARAKTDVRPLDRALERVGMMSGYTYAMTAGHGARTHGGGRRHTGLLAQEVELALPEAVFSVPRPPGAVGEDGREGRGGYSSVAYGNVVALLVQAVNELSARLEAVEAGDRAAAWAGRRR